MSDSLNFDSLAPIEVPVTIEGKPYVLVEGSEAVISLYRNAISRATGRDADGKPVPGDGFADTEMYLLSMCFFSVVDGEPGKPPMRVPVPLLTIKGWVHSVVSKLIDKCEQIHKIGNWREKTEEEKKQAKEAAKN